MNVEPASHRDGCTRCHKPRVTCICDRVPRIATRTRITVLQHPRERFHPLGTTRFVELGLQNSRVEVCFGMHAPRSSRELAERTAVLYPFGDATDLSTLHPAQRPEHLIVLDGTWSHAHVMRRELAWLHELPHVALSPESPGRYRIRREPRPECLSTIEAVVAALRVLEPETQGLDDMLAAFDAMIDQQIALMQERRSGGRRRGRPARPRRAIPRALSEQLSNVVVVYGESSARVAGTDRGPRDLVQWVAARAGTLETFEGFARPAARLPSERHLGHMGLDAASFDAASAPEQLAAAWDSFLRPDDVVAAWNQSTLDLCRALGTRSQMVLLKSAYCNERGRGPGTLDEVVAREALTRPNVDVKGRAAARLGNAVALAHWLHARARA